MNSDLPFKVHVYILQSSLFLVARTDISDHIRSDATLWTSYLTHLVPCSGCCSVAQSCLTLCDPMGCSTPGFPVLHHLPEFAQTHVHWVGNAIQPPHPLLSPSPPAFNLSQHQGLFQWVGSPISWPKYWSFSFSISLSNQYSGLIYFRIDWFDLLAVQETLKSLLQHHNLKASILQHSVFFMVQLSHLYMTTMVYSFDYTYLVQVGQVIRDPRSILTQWHNNKRINTAYSNNGDRNGIQLQYKHITKNNCILFQLSMNPGEKNKFSNSLHLFTKVTHCTIYCPLAQRSSRIKPIFSRQDTHYFSFTWIPGQEKNFRNGKSKEEDGIILPPLCHWYSAGGKDHVKVLSLQGI